MLSSKREHPKEKTGLHLRNRHRERYDFQELVKSCPELASFVRLNDYQDASIDFFDPAAVKTLNKALLQHYYGIGYWDIPDNYLCPPIPGRADYLHYLADLLASQVPGNAAAHIPRGPGITGLDIGVGANCVYPLIGNATYGWSFLGSDIDPGAITSANHIIQKNPHLQGQVACRLQPDPGHIFTGIIQPGEKLDFTLCNPPFHASATEARAGSVRKVRNLKQQRNAKPVLNFGGQQNELWCPGGEEKFIGNMIRESRSFASNCFWFSTLVSKADNLRKAYQALKKVGPTEVKTIPMSQGNKNSRILAWTFLSPAQKSAWTRTRWPETF